MKLLKIIGISLILVFLIGAFMVLFSSVSDIALAITDTIEEDTDAGDNNSGTGNNNSGTGTNNTGSSNSNKFRINFPSSISVRKFNGDEVKSGDVAEETVYHLEYVGFNKIYVNGKECGESDNVYEIGNLNITLKPCKTK